VFKHLPSGQERSVCPCVSKRWLMLLRNILMDEIAECNCIESEGYLVRSIFGRDAKDVKLAAITIETPNHGELENLYIQGNNPCRGVIDAGLATIAPGFPTLIDLSLSIVSFIVGKGLSEIVYGLHILEKLDIFQCQIITDKYLLDFSKNCPNMNSLTTDSCSNIWNYSLKFVAGNTTIDLVGGMFRKLTHIELSGLLRITDEGIIPIVQNCAANFVVSFNNS
uniref:F-box domain-containing protein n=1 Tax=Solanum lycopersicum TaxID=4081 RepID=A0A3Q7HL15_SOLLC